MRLYADGIKDWRYDRWTHLLNKHRNRYCERWFKRIKRLIMCNKIWFSSHALDRICERAWWIKYVMTDLRRHCGEIMYNTEHWKFYITWEKHRYAISSDDFSIITVSPRKYRMDIYREDILAYCLWKDII